ncbi:MAG: GNAT family N-acetyltransferase [Pseudomonadota bacterium]|nr:GNAT family N-acetyltransferase [Pseudomonadota bacterium]
MNAVKVLTPASSAEWAAYYELRWRILRAPWQQTGCERDETDDSSIHRMLCRQDGKALAVGRLHRLDEHSGQIRYMAVESGYERRSYGTIVVTALEQAAIEIGIEKIILHARERAVPFYQHHGYKSIEPSFLLFDEIQHYLMTKNLSVVRQGFP